ncbi:MAG: HK97 family phage prohead protease [Lachnospiraceae bacterium]|nr:HK97 family phage prohead protease [Lachnospiraceae bacterium]
MKRSDVATRSFEEYAIRAVEGSDRKFTLSFSSEIAYQRGWGMEVLDHSDGAVDLSRISEIGCLLFNHNRDQVIGKINRAWIENNRGYAEVEFDDDEFSEKICKKVKNRSLKGVSVGYRVDSWEEVMPGKSSADGKYTGPCDIARRWTPFEISIVSVPADPTVGVGRTMETGNPSNLQDQKRSIDFYERQIQANINLILGGQNDE